MLTAWLISSDPKNVENRNYIFLDTVVSNTGIKVLDATNIKELNRLLLDPTVNERFDITLTDSVETNSPLGSLNQQEYEAELERFRIPHFHYTDEIRHIKDGGVYIDVLLVTKEWVRLHITAGTAIIIPAGLYHSISLDEHYFVVATGYYISKGLNDEYVPIYYREESDPVTDIYRNTLNAIKYETMA